MKKVKKAQAQKKKSNYTRVGNNIYSDGSTYRVRVSVEGVRRSKNFTSLKEAYAFRKLMLSQQGA